MTKQFKVLPMGKPVAHVNEAWCHCATCGNDAYVANLLKRMAIVAERIDA